MVLFRKAILQFSKQREKQEVTSDLPAENLPRLQKGLRNSPPILIKIPFLWAWNKFLSCFIAFDFYMRRYRIRILKRAVL
ncbi:hypothetical protein TNCT_451341 [Trichonephila clavata]|uniref:Uncharacterized protein n=1 Tax=Trichonephila clavata TaxID=2740835 RepID=A0A8X6FLV7_TRICU|nr:hypothetical protein TNCT_451341 [Trichonephila clavata]